MQLTTRVRDSGRDSKMRDDFLIVMRLDNSEHENPKSVHAQKRACAQVADFAICAHAMDGMFARKGISRSASCEEALR